MELILKIAACIGAFSTIIAAIITVYKVVKKWDDYITESRLYRKDTDRRIDENTMYTLKLVIMNADLSLEERIAAGDKYIELGGNGYVKHIYQELLQQVEVK